MPWFCIGSFVQAFTCSYIFIPVARGNAIWHRLVLAQRSGVSAHVPSRAPLLPGFSGECQGKGIFLAAETCVGSEGEPGLRCKAVVAVQDHQHRYKVHLWALVCTPGSLVLVAGCHREVKRYRREQEMKVHLRGKGVYLHPSGSAWSTVESSSSVITFGISLFCLVEDDCYSVVSYLLFQSPESAATTYLVRRAEERAAYGITWQGAVSDLQQP